MKSELLPCPFCGGIAEIIEFGQEDGENAGGSCVACTKCQASGPVEFGFKENFVSNWNCRPALREAPAGFVPVPVEPTGEMVSAAEEAYMPFGDMGLAIQMAIAARPQEVKDGA